MKHTKTLPLKSDWLDPLALLNVQDLARLKVLSHEPASVGQLSRTLGPPHTRAAIEGTMGRLLVRNLVVQYKPNVPRPVYIYEISALGEHCLKGLDSC